MITLLIARHGNTFEPGDTVLRVGKRTDLALSNSGREQARRLGAFLNEKYKHIDHVFVSSLKRTQETASIALPNHKLKINPIFDEIDYGIDDGKPEAEVVARIGAGALKQWEEQGIPPSDWKIDPEAIKQDWQQFAKKCIEHYPFDSTILVVTSNGIARFAPYLLNDFEIFQQSHSLKMRTGAMSVFHYVGAVWQAEYWNLSPSTL